MTADRHTARLGELLDTEHDLVETLAAATDPQTRAGVYRQTLANLAEQAATHRHRGDDRTAAGLDRQVRLVAAAARCETLRAVAARHHRHVPDDPRPLLEALGAAPARALAHVVSLYTAAAAPTAADYAELAAAEPGHRTHGVTF